MALTDGSPSYDNSDNSSSIGTLGGVVAVSRKAPEWVKINAEHAKRALMTGRVGANHKDEEENGYDEFVARGMEAAERVFDVEAFALPRIGADRRAIGNETIVVSAAAASAIFGRWLIATTEAANEYTYEADD